MNTTRFPNHEQPFTMVARRIRARLIDGVLRRPDWDSGEDDAWEPGGVMLVATNLPEALPTTVQWDVSFQLDNVETQPQGFTFDVPEYQTIDLTTVIPSTPQPGTVTVVSTETLERAELAAARAEQAEAGAVEARDETVAILDYVAGGWWPKYDPATGEYDTDEVSRFVGARRDGLVYGVEAPKGAATACTKTGANAGVANPVPSVIGAPGSDPYLNRGPFFTIEANGYVDNAGWPHITALEGDANFSRTGSQDVWILTPVLWWRQVEASSTMTFEVSDSYRPGFELQPKAVLPDGRRRPFMLFAKYALSQVDGVARSVSGQQPLTSTVSHDSLITICKNATTGYSGKSYADDWYVKMMFLLKYANKSSQSVFAGVSSVSGGTVADLRATGTCDAVPGRDGAPTNPLDPTQPFVLQGIELMLGMYETLADVIFANTGDGWRPRLLLDSKFAATSVTAAYIDSGVEVPTTDSSWQYSLYPRSAGGLLFGDGLGGNATAGTGDGTYVNPASTIAARQWLGLGSLSVIGRAGLFFVFGNYALGYGYWPFGSRLSAVGRAA